MISIVLHVCIRYQGYRIFNTWMGDPHKLVLLEAVINTIRQEDLFTSVKRVGKTLQNGLNELQVGIYQRALRLQKVLEFTVENHFIISSQRSGELYDMVPRHN